jgi:hypothetical protein
MFVAHCETCGQRTLMGTERIVAIHNDTTGIRAVFRCHCGTVGIHRSGRPRSGRPDARPRSQRRSDRRAGGLKSGANPNQGSSIGA